MIRRRKVLQSEMGLLGAGMASRSYAVVLKAGLCLVVQEYALALMG